MGTDGLLQVFGEVLSDRFICISSGMNLPRVSSEKTAYVGETLGGCCRLFLWLPTLPKNSFGRWTTRPAAGVTFFVSGSLPL